MKLRHWTRRAFFCMVLGASAFAAQARIHGGIAPGGGNTLLKTVTLSNTSGGATPINSHTPMLNLLFKQGDVPTGTWPVLKTAGGTTVPFTYTSRTSWPDGSIKCLPVLPRFPDAISGASTAALKIYNGGSAQSASARTLAEVYAANITVVGTTGINNITGDWTCALQAANIIETVSYGDGPGGRVWRFLCDFKQGGSAHGQLVAYFFIMALQDNSGNLAGFRVLPRVTQPYYNYDTPTKDYRSFTSLTLQYGGGPTIFDPMANSYSAKTFTWGNTGQANDLCNSTGHGYQGGVAVRLTTTGTLPAGLSTGTTYWIYFNDANSFYFCDGSAVGAMNNGITRQHVTSAGAGTHTMTPIPYVSHFCSYWCATTEGKYVYVQGGGSVATEATIRVLADKTYDHTTKVLPPYELSIGTVTSNPNYDWAPYSAGPLYLFIGTAGERDDVGVLSGYHSRHFNTQAAVDEKLMRLIGLSQGHLPMCLIDHATLNTFNIGSGAYAGMPANVSGSFQWRNGNTNGSFTAPANGLCLCQCFGGTDISHQTQYSAYPYIVTGEPQYLELVKEAANGTMALAPTSDRNMTVSAVNYLGIGPCARDATRTGAWTYRDTVFAGGLVADADPNGSAVSTYFRDNAARQSTYLVAYIASLSAWSQANGFWYPQAMANGRASWQDGYAWSAACLHAGLCNDSNALSVVTTFSQWPIHVKSFTTNLFALGTYYERSSKSLNTEGAPLIDSDLEWGAYGYGAAGFSWADAGDLFTWTGPTWTPANGDKVCFRAANVPTGLTLNVQYYAVNVSGNTFQLSATIGGAPIAISADGSAVANDFTVLPSTPPATQYIGQNFNSSSGYGANQYGCINWSIALGVTGLAACSTEMASRESPSNYLDCPKYRMATSF